MARERTWNSRRKSSSHAHIDIEPVLCILFICSLSDVIYLFEKMGRMKGGEKNKL